jgi:hypothetical protein
VIACADGRWRPHVDGFVTTHLALGSAYDSIAVPGGVEPLTLLDLVPKDFNFFRRRLEMLVRSHTVRHIVLIAHENCGWYRERRIGPITVDLQSRQIADLKRVRARCREWFPDVQVDAYYARLDGAQQVVFGTV